jgi:hypothetical protein
VVKVEKTCKQQRIRTVMQQFHSRVNITDGQNSLSLQGELTVILTQGLLLAKRMALTPFFFKSYAKGIP